jgi:hypothetical protein
VPNFIITNVCNLSCPFCFASEHIDGEQQGKTGRMSIEEFSRQLAFIGDQVVRFCGGEPTLHPQFIEMVELALARPNGQAYAMTNGVWPHPVRTFIAGLSRRDRKRVGFLFNVLQSEHYRPEQEQALYDTLAVVDKEHATLGVTLYEPTFDHTRLFALADRYGFRRIRYSVASPNVSDPRSWLVDPARDFPGLAKIVYALTMAAQARGIFIHSDCGYLPPCMFTEQQIADMYPPGDRNVKDAFSCNGPIDIGPGGDTWRCYGLYSTMRTNTADFPDSRALGDYFETRTRETPFTPLFDACATCEIRERYHCAGGCYALRSVKGMKERAGEALIQIGADPALGKAVPRLKNVHVSAQGAVMLCEPDGTWSKLPLTALEQRVLLACDGQRSVDALSALVNAPAARVVRRFFEQGAIDLATSDDDPTHPA